LAHVIVSDGVLNCTGGRFIWTLVEPRGRTDGGRLPAKVIDR
jgi:hypothetical protein